MNVAIVGCGLIGHKRAKNLNGHNLVIAADVVMDKAEALARQYPEAIPMQSWEAAVSHESVEIVIVATTPDNLARVTLAALHAGKHVLVDKPAGTPLRRVGCCNRVGRKQKIKSQNRLQSQIPPRFAKSKKDNRLW